MATSGYFLVHDRLVIVALLDEGGTLSLNNKKRTINETIIDSILYEKTVIVSENINGVDADQWAALPMGDFYKYLCKFSNVQVIVIQG